MAEYPDVLILGDGVIGLTTVAATVAGTFARHLCQAPLAGRVTIFDLIVWLAHREAKALIGFDAVPPGKK